jgi:hypothetical protein
VGRRGLPGRGTIRDRSIHLTLQSIFVAVGAGLYVAVLSFQQPREAVLAATILTVNGVVSMCLVSKMRSLILARGADVTFWHRRLLATEQELAPNERYLTEFKIAQKEARAGFVNLDDLFLTRNPVTVASIDLLVERGLGHTRKVFDKWLFTGIWTIWRLLLIIGIGHTYLRLMK